MRPRDLTPAPFPVREGEQRSRSREVDRDASPPAPGGERGVGFVEGRGAGTRGFTLIEVLVALAVMSMIAITIWAASSQTARTREVVQESHDKSHQVRVAFEMITRDLSSAFLSDNRAQTEPTHDTVFIGQDHGEEDRVDFAAFTHERRFFDAKESDQAEVGYFLAPDKENPEQQNLVRREAPVLDLEPLEGGQLLVLVENVKVFDLQYYDVVMAEWQDAWDTTEATEDGSVLPFQVRVRLETYDRLGEVVAYATQVPIPMRTPILRDGYTPGEHVVVQH
jgi:general secretion pathway protein J